MNSNKISHTQKIKGPDNLKVSDFWSWAYSDIMSNTNRSAFAEFLVATALGVTDTPRIEWNAFDIEYKNKKIEVKCSAYLQSWYQKELSRITFDIARKLPWNPKTNKSGKKRVRSADCYVFCLYPETDPKKADVLDADAWKFYVLSKKLINKEFGDQKSVGLARLDKLCEPVGYIDLRKRIDQVL
jgi:hypothetical protein